MSVRKWHRLSFFYLDAPWLGSCYACYVCHHCPLDVLQHLKEYVQKYYGHSHTVECYWKDVDPITSIVVGDRISLFNLRKFIR